MSTRESSSSLFRSLARLSARLLAPVQVLKRRYSRHAGHAGLAGVLAVLLGVAALPISGLSDDTTDEPLDPRPRVVMNTTLGAVTLELDRARAPATVENFLEYVDSGFYDGTIFHRVIEGFMVQGGGFTEDFIKKSTRAPVRNEADNGLSNRRMTIAMARTSEPHSATAQFFINDVDNTNLDHTGQNPRGWGYTVFGQVVDGEATIDAIAEVSTGSAGPFRSDVPRDTVLIVSAERVTDGDDTDTQEDVTDSETKGN